MFTTPSFFLMCTWFRFINIFFFIFGIYLLRHSNEFNWLYCLRNKCTSGATYAKIHTPFSTGKSLGAKRNLWRLILRSISLSLIFSVIFTQFLFPVFHMTHELSLISDSNDWAFSLFSDYLWSLLHEWWSSLLFWRKLTLNLFCKLLCLSVWWDIKATKKIFHVPCKGKT